MSAVGTSSPCRSCAPARHGCSSCRYPTTDAHRDETPCYAWAEDGSIRSTDGSSAPAHAWQVSLPPDVEHQQAPQNLLVVPRARNVLGNEAACRVGVEEPDTDDLLGGQARLEGAAQRPPHPQTEWNAEALLATSEDGVGDQAAQRTLENVLGPPALQLERRRHATCELHEGAVEEWRPRLEAARHARSIHRDEVLVGKIALAVLVDELVE